MTTTAARLTPFVLLVALDGNGLAEGSLYLDDGEQISLDVYSSVSYDATSVDYADESYAAGGIIQSTVITSLYSSPQVLTKIQIKGISTIKGDFAATPESCTATLTLSGATPTTVVLSPEIVQYNDYSELVVSLEDLNLNIVSDYSLSWKCVSSDDSGKNSNDDEEGWGSLPTYAQALIICSILVVLVGVTFGGYKFYVLHGGGTKKSHSSPLLPTNETPGERSAGSLSIA